MPTSDFYEFGAQLRAFMSGLGGAGRDSGRAITDRSSWAGLGDGSSTLRRFPTSTTHRRSRSSRLRLAGSITSGCHPLIPS